MKTIVKDFNGHGDIRLTFYLNGGKFIRLFHRMDNEGAERMIRSYTKNEGWKRV